MNGEKSHEALSLINELQAINLSYLDWGESAFFRDEPPDELSNHAVSPKHTYT